MEKRKTTK